MHTFFQGWRRKAGLVLLVMACAMFGLWCRSLWIVDVVSAFQVRLQSVNGDLILFTDTAQSDERAMHWLTEYFDPDWQYVQLSSPMVEWQFQVAGFGVGMVNQDYHVLGPSAAFASEGIAYLRIISWWHLIAPFTLLSAYLILWKPRKRT